MNTKTKPWYEIFRAVVVIVMMILFIVLLTKIQAYEKPKATTFSVQAKGQIVSCPVNLDCKRCDYRIITKSDGTMVCRLIKCRGCKQVEQPPTFTPRPTHTPIPTATDFEPLPYPEPSVVPYP